LERAEELGFSVDQFDRNAQLAEQRNDAVWLVLSHEAVIDEVGFQSIA
jgi:hypothetical protein